ncbi:Rad52/Rad22 family DNA repair protein [Chryseobacterium indologenes]|uniref:Rad52/Rad22 family DNA repair protein n=1 Tax=Chryseobacterium indologenes TaxID=253 RepID=UPI001BD13385|nr:Rad52/Rad22 family DNA repair protein [Chryseobacterium indologenes]
MADPKMITTADISKSNDLILSIGQLNGVIGKTPEKAKKVRPAKGGGTWTYVSGSYMKKQLNILFGWNWDFEIVSEQILVDAGEVVVKGKLTCRSNGQTIVKMQYGNKDIMFKKGTKTPLSIGNDLKAAATDALKKCAAEIGIAQDVYGPEDFKDVEVVDEITTGKSNTEKMQAHGQL